MYLKYKQMHIVKHALKHYIKREGASEHDLMVEQNLLKKVTQEIDDFKELEQELAKLSPKQLADIQNTISQVFYEFGKALGNDLDGLVAFFKNGGDN